MIISTVLRHEDLKEKIKGRTTVLSRQAGEALEAVSSRALSSLLADLQTDAFKLSTLM